MCRFWLDHGSKSWPSCAACVQLMSLFIRACFFDRTTSSCAILEPQLAPELRSFSQCVLCMHQNFKLNLRTGSTHELVLASSMCVNVLLSLCDLLACPMRPLQRLLGLWAVPNHSSKPEPSEELSCCCCRPHRMSGTPACPSSMSSSSRSRMLLSLSQALLQPCGKNPWYLVHTQNLQSAAW